MTASLQLQRAASFPQGSCPTSSISTPSSSCRCATTVIKSEMPVLGASKRYLVIDDIYDTGDTCHKVAHALTGFNCDFCFCMSRYKSHGITAKVLDHSRWIVFPWE